jgi:uncharacterized protein YndB with AHSA1/START domain
VNHTPPGVTSSASREIKASPERLLNAVLDPAALLAWLPPAGKTGRMHAFDARAGGGYWMSLYYLQDDKVRAGKSSEKEDLVNVRILELSLPQRIVQTVTFVTDDAAPQGEMSLIRGC